MSYNPDDYDKTWVEMPAQSAPQRSNRWLMAVAIGAVAAGLLCICGAGLYLLYTQFQARTTIVPPAPILVPTSPVEPAVTPPAVSEGGDSPTAIPAAPTSTLPADAPAPPTPAQAPGGSIPVVRFAAAPAIDGQLGEWGAVPATEGRFQVYTRGDWDGSDDLQAVWQLGWDDAHLYVAVTVTDDTHVQTQSGNTTFRGDGLEMQLDTNRQGDYGARLSEDDFQLLLSPGDFGAIAPSAWRFRGEPGGRMTDSPGHAIEVAASRTATGYVLEARIPWRDLNVPPAPRLILGVSLNANDNDRVGEAVQEVMKSQVSTRTFSDPTSWGTMELR